MDYAFTYIQKNGIATEDSYPYQGVTGMCKSDIQAVGTVSKFTDVPEGDENALLAALQTSPVSIAIDAQGLAFQLYRGGVFKAKCGDQLDHGVLLVGYGNDNGQAYWKIKNSWGAQWGEQGYIRFIYGYYECALAYSASYPTA